MFNQSNLDLDRFDFKRYLWCAHTRIELILVRGIGISNIVFYAGQYYVLPLSLGPLDFHHQDIAWQADILAGDSSRFN